MRDGVKTLTPKIQGGVRVTRSKVICCSFLCMKLQAAFSARTLEAAYLIAGWVAAPCFLVTATTASFHIDSSRTALSEASPIATPELVMTMRFTAGLRETSVRLQVGAVIFRHDEPELFDTLEYIHGAVNSGLDDHCEDER